jgi:hypothetical protein
MEHESLEFKVVIDAGKDTEVLARVAHLGVASAAYMATVAKFPNRNIQLRHGASIIKRHDGEPKPEPPKDPNLKAWSAHLIGGKKLIFLGVVEGASEPAAIEAAALCSTWTTCSESGWL